VIISASRRTDIPAFYAPWLIERLAARRVRVVNPFNPRQARDVSLAPEDVDAIVFWTRDPAALADRAPDIERLGHRRTVALVTITGYERDLEPDTPPAAAAIRGFRRLAGEWGGPDRLAWRYDPIVIGARLAPDDHRRLFARLAAELEGATRRVVVSFLDVYRKTQRRLGRIERAIDFDFDPVGATARALLADLAAMAAARGMSLATCAEPLVDPPARVALGRCVDPLWLSALFPDRVFPRRKDPGQRPHCRCAPAVDVGAPDTCGFGCVYCYAVASPERSAARRATHHPEHDCLVNPPNGRS